MKFSDIRPVFGRIRNALRKNPDGFLRYVSGVVHVGANSGQERNYYANLGVRVIWIEPNPEVFSDLKENIKGLSNQRAFQALISNIDGKEYQFNIANNQGLSSSILNLKRHSEFWPNIFYKSTIALQGTTLASLLQRERVLLSEYQALVLDTQGSELLALQGSVPILDAFSYIKVEVADFESYEGCCQLTDISAFMEQFGYKEYSRNKIASRPTGGNYFDIVYSKT